MTWVDLWPTVSLMSWIGTPLLLMIDTAVCRPSWACQWPIPARLVILLNRQLSASRRVLAPVLVAEHEVGVLPRLAGGEPFGGLALPVRREGVDGALGQDQGAPGLRRLGVAVSPRRAPDVDHAVVQVHVIPGERAQLARPQAERDGQDEQGLKPRRLASACRRGRVARGTRGRSRPSGRCSISVTGAFLRGLLPHASSPSSVAAWVAAVAALADPDDLDVRGRRAAGVVEHLARLLLGHGAGRASGLAVGQVDEFDHVPADEIVTSARGGWTGAACS